MILFTAYYHNQEYTLSIIVFIAYYHHQEYKLSIIVCSKYYHHQGYTLYIIVFIITLINKYTLGYDIIYRLLS